MQLFRMMAELNGVNLAHVYLKDNYVSFGWPGIGNLENVSKDEFAGTWSEAVRPAGAGQGQLQLQWMERLGEVSTFVYEMRDGDYVLIFDGELVHLGDLGDYYYVDALDDAEVGGCHRRGVTWLRSAPIEELHEELRQFACLRTSIAKFGRTVTSKLLEAWMTPLADAAAKNSPCIQVDRRTIEEALDILKEAMRSSDADRRERAAIAILQYAKIQYEQ